MIDTWLIFTLFIPFMEVILQTRMAVVNRRLKSMDLVLDMNSSKNSENKENTWIHAQDKLDVLKKRDTQTLKYCTMKTKQKIRPTETNFLYFFLFQISSKVCKIWLTHFDANFLLCLLYCRNNFEFHVHLSNCNYLTI